MEISTGTCAYRWCGRGPGGRAGLLAVLTLAATAALAAEGAGAGLQQLLQRLDRDGSGTLSREELGTEYRWRMRRLDANGDDELDAEEMRRGMVARAVAAGAKPRAWQRPAQVAGRRLAPPEAGQEFSGVNPFEQSQIAVTEGPIDKLVQSVLQQKGLELAPACSDGVFIRRVFLDVIGTLPTPAEVGEFLSDERPDKRSLLIESLLLRDEFADYWALKWCDLLRVKAEFPINLWPNGVQAYHRWIRDAVATNMPYDRFALELLTSSGSNFRVPPVNFYRAVQGREPAAIASAVALTFMGMRLDAADPAVRSGMEAFFARIAFKPTAEWKEEIVQLDPAPAGRVFAVFPDGTRAVVPADADPRRVFADWLTAPGNPWFARSITNRAWYWLFGRAFIEEPDDIRPDNPPVHAEVLDFLAAELTGSGYDLRHLYRLILNSGVYQQSPLPRVAHPEAERLFAHYPVRRLGAEVLIDALCAICGDGEGYSSMIPEPFTFVPEDRRTIALADGSTTSSFLEMFGRPARDTGLESERSNQVTVEQRLHLLNSTHVQQKLIRSWKLDVLVKRSQGSLPATVRALYLSILSRPPTQAELQTAEEYLKRGGGKSKTAVADLAWALINTKEFLYRH